MSTNTESESSAKAHDNHDNIEESLEDASKVAPEGETSALAVLQEELKQEKNRYLYLYAEFDTYKKRTFKERSELIKFGHETFARELLSAKDNLERSLQFATSAQADLGDQWIAGIRLVIDELSRTFEKFNIKEIKSAGEKFDPMLHEAVGQEKSSIPEQDGKVIKEQQKGYTLHGRLLRPAKVIVGTAN